MQNTVEALVEAMASGNPVMAAANAGYRTVWIDKGVNYLTPPGDSEVLFEKLSLLVNKPELRKALGSWGREEAKKYDVANLVSEFERIYETGLIERSVRKRNKLG